MIMLDKNKGQGIIEYALIFTFVIIVLIVILVLFGNSMNHLFQNIIHSIS
jgi:Flp pilus assembly pilin Flp